MTAKPRITARSRSRFLRELAASCNVTASAAKAGHPRASFYRLRDQDEEFARAWAEALAEAVDRLEAEAFRIAVEGVAERTYDADGRLVSTRRREDPRLIQFLLAAHRPGVYSERRRLELSGVQGGPVPLELNGARVTSLGDLLEYIVEHQFELPERMVAAVRTFTGELPEQPALPPALPPEEQP